MPTGPSGSSGSHAANNRSGDEDEILSNIERCSASIAAAEPLADITARPSALFEYVVDNEKAVTLGFAALRSALPYLYGTRHRLGRVRLELDDGTVEEWTPGNLSATEPADPLVSERAIHVGGTVVRELRIVRVGEPGSPVGALVLVERGVDGRWAVVTPSSESPRVYRQYPLRDSTFLPIELVLDGDFEPDQERSKVLMSPTDREALSSALRSATHAVTHAYQAGWRGAYRLARADNPITCFDPSNAEELEWWRGQLRSFAERLARQPIVETTRGMFPADDPDGIVADFIAPRLLDRSGADETTIERMWELAAEATDIYPPTRELATEWSATVDGWERLGVQLSRITAETLARWVRSDAESLDQLHLDGDPVAWLAAFLDVVGECWARRGGVEASLLRDLIPNQNALLRSPSSLRRNAGVPDELKNLCALVGLDERDGLLSEALAHAARQPGLEHAGEALATAIPRVAQALEVEHELLDHLTQALPDGRECSEATAESLRGSVLFLDYLWRTRGADAASVAQQIPLAADNRVLRWSATRLMMAPVAAWGEAAREFKAAYPSERVLDDVYMSPEGVVPALVQWEMAIADPISRSRPPELDGTRLAGMVEDGFDSSGVTIRGEEFSEIALLAREVINHVQDDVHARALLGLVLCHVAPNDEGWRQRRCVRGTRSREAVDVPLRGALWLGDLKSRAWVPVPGEDGNLAKVTASAATLRPLLDPIWLEGNDAAIELLTACFGFDELDLRLLGIPESAQVRVRRALAGILETGGANPEFYEALARDAEVRSNHERDVNRFRRIGLAVQEAVRQTLAALGLRVRVVDYGYDFAVTPDGLAGFALDLDAGPYLVEVKATTAGPVSLTPRQAGTAAAQVAKYILCVVDLRHVPDDRLEEEWTPSDVEPLISMLADIGARVSDTYGLVTAARNSTVGIRNENVLRYEVQPETWSMGQSLSAWVASIQPERSDA